MGEYSPAETKMIICLTRERDCTPTRCLKCGWCRKEDLENLNKWQKEWESHKDSATHCNMLRSREGENY
jgi:S-ribosylhomocysteine lyase LuxS involved in autoinducer biosynthesis